MVCTQEDIVSVLMRDWLHGAEERILQAVPLIVSFCPMLTQLSGRHKAAQPPAGSQQRLFLPVQACASL